MKCSVPTKTILVKGQQSYSIFRKFCNFCMVCNFSNIIIASCRYLDFQNTFSDPLVWGLGFHLVKNRKYTYIRSLLIFLFFLRCPDLNKVFLENAKLDLKNFNCFISLSIALKIYEGLWEIYNIFEGIAKYMKKLGHFSVVLELAIKYVSKVSDTHPWKYPQKGGQIAAAYLEPSRTSWLELFLPKKVNKPVLLLGSKYAPELNHSIKLLAVLPKSTDKNVRVSSLKYCPTN